MAESKNIAKEAKEINYDSVVSKLLGEDMSPEQEKDWETYKRTYDEASEIKRNK